MRYIDIDKNEIPYRFDMRLKDITYTFEINYNTEFDFFTIDLLKDEKLIVLGEKLIYGRPLFESCGYLDIPQLYIMPYDLSEQESRITFANLNEKIFLYILDEEGVDESMET